MHFKVDDIVEEISTGERGKIIGRFKGYSSTRLWFLVEFGIITCNRHDGEGKIPGVVGKSNQCWYLEPKEINFISRGTVDNEVKILIPKFIKI